jgi:hypothetical protein
MIRKPPFLSGQGYLNPRRKHSSIITAWAVTCDKENTYRIVRVYFLCGDVGTFTYGCNSVYVAKCAPMKDVSESISTLLSSSLQYNLPFHCHLRFVTSRINGLQHGEEKKRLHCSHGCLAYPHAASFHSASER